MNLKRCLLAAAALFVFFSVYDGIIHGMLLKGTYAQCSSMWRKAPDMMAKMPFHILMNLFFAGWLTYLFTKLFPKGGIKNGLYFGLYFGVFSGLQAAATYYWLPICLGLAALWFVVYCFAAVVGGAILGAICKH